LKQRQARSFSSDHRSEALLVQDVVVHAPVPSPDLVWTVARVVGECLDELQVAVECPEVIAFEIDVEVRVDPREAVCLVPALDMCVVAGPGFESLEPSLTALPFRFLEQRERNAAALMIGGWVARCQIIPPRPGLS
jgi:hypothetical protein